MVRGGADDVAPTIFLIDFGLARQFRSPATHLHISFTLKHSIVGTLPFLSIHGQQGHTQSRRDDLESLAYTIIFLARGKLPWSSVSICGDHEAVLRKKISISAKQLCEGLPPLFTKFVNHVRSLGFDEKPDYTHLHTILSECSETEANQLSTPLATTQLDPISSDEEFDLRGHENVSDASDTDASNRPPEPAVHATRARNSPNSALDIHHFFTELEFPTAAKSQDRVRRACTLCM